MTNDKYRKDLLLLTDPKSGQQQIEIQESDVPMLAKAMRQAQPNKLLKMKAVIEATGLSRSRLYALMATKEFPAAIKEGASSLWSAQAVQEWIDAKASDAKAS